MSARLLRTITAVLLVMAGLGVIAAVTHSVQGGNRIVATGGGAGNAAVRDAFVGAGAPPTTASTDGFPPSGSGPQAGTSTATSASAAAPPTTQRRLGTTTVAPTKTTAPIGSRPVPLGGSIAALAAGPASGRLAVTLAVARGNGVGVGGGIATMAADGGDRHVLVPGNFAVPQWTPDGRFVVFVSTDSYATWAAAVGGGQPIQLAPELSGPISPDGTRVVHPSGPPGGTAATPLVVQPIAETPSGLVTAGAPSLLGVSGFDPKWSPDGHRVLYATQFGSSSGLAVVDADGTHRQDLLASAPVQALLLSAPGFSADGSTVSFLGTDNHAYFVGADGQNLRLALPDVVAGQSNSTVFATAWSPDHQRLALLIDGAHSVAVVDTNRHLLASVRLSMQASPTGLSFDGSGQHIYYLGSPDSPPGLFNLYSIGLDGTRSHQLSSDGSILLTPTVLP